MPLQTSFFDQGRRLETDFRISLEADALPIQSSPVRINCGMVCLCLCGCAEVEVNLRNYTIGPNDIVTVFPGQVLAQNSCSDDFKLAFFSFSDLLIQEIIYRFPSSFIGFLKERVFYALPASESADVLSGYFVPLQQKFLDVANVCRREIVLNLLRNFYLDLYNKVLKNNEINFRQRKRKSELFEMFYQMLLVLHKQSREVAFYAEKLCITPKYLSIVTQEVSGSSAKELIDKYIIMEMKLLLKSSDVPLKEVVELLHFPNEAFLCKYFKKHTGITPMRYRNSMR